MLRIAGSSRHTFSFPADLPTAFAYYSDVGRILTYLPHIFLVQAYAYDQFRMLYSTLELGVYHIRIFCDLRTTLGVARDRWAIHINPLVRVEREGRVLFAKLWSELDMIHGRPAEDSPFDCLGI